MDAWLPATDAPPVADDAAAVPRRRDSVALPRRIGRGLANAARAVLDLALPPVCLACRRPVADDHALCIGCWRGLKLIDRPYCERLGTPFPFDPGPETLSPAAIASPPPYGRARAAAVYGEVAGRLVHALKYRDRTEIAALLGRLAAAAGRDILGEADVLVPVPLHRRRLWARRFNQSAAIAFAVGDRSGVPVDPFCLERVKPTPRQVGLDRRARADNVRGAFRVPPRGRPAVAGRRVVLVDDVLTSGATVAAATRALLKAGAASVDVLVFARVVFGEES